MQPWSLAPSGASVDGIQPPFGFIDPRLQHFIIRIETLNQTFGQMYAISAREFEGSGLKRNHVCQIHVVLRH